MNREYLQTTQFSKQNILSQVYTPNGFDGVNANADISAVVREHKRRVFSKTLLYGSSAGLGLSIFNLTRIGVLSPSGKQAALFGTLFFSFLTYAAYDRVRLLRPQPVVEEEAPKNESQ
eukprot:403374817